VHNERRIAALATALLLVGGAAGIGATAAAGWDRPVPWLQVPGFLALLVAAGYLIIRYQYGREVYALDLFEAVLSPALFVLPPVLVVVLAGLSKTIVGAIHRNQPLKAIFNTAQWMAATGLGALTFTSIRSGTDLNPRNFVALVAAMVVVGVTNHLSLAFVLSLAQGRRMVDVMGGMVSLIVTGWLGGWAVNTVFGVLFVSAFLRSPLAILLFFVPLVLLHWGSRGYATALADRTRLAGLHSATHVLAQPIDPREAVGNFLAEVRTCFEAECAELVLVSPEGHETHRADEEGHRILEGEHPLGAALIHAGRAVRLTTADPATPLAAVLAQAGWRDCAAAPVRSGARLIGVLCTYNRGGLEGFEEGELAVLEALANEVAGALHKAELLATILEERRKLSEIVDNTSDGIFTLDPAGVVESWNAALEQLTGYPASEMIGTSHLGVLRPRDAAGSDVLFERWAEDADTNNADLPNDVQVLTSTGELRWLFCSYTRVPAGDDRPPLLVVVGRDVTKVRELERLKEEFVATVSHELRTPLTPIKGFATTLLEGGDRMSSETRRTAVESILRSAQRLERLILNLLEVSRIESRVVDVRNSSVEVCELTQRVVREFRDAWGDRDIEMSLPQRSCLALGSELWIEQILSNLLSNALKYATGTEPIELTVRMDGDAVELCVADHGAGIPPEAAERVFERFERLDRSNRQAGTGLGLYIARELAHAMNGTLTLSDTPGHGATFSLRLRPAAGQQATMLV
jgi:PAS domain S-box-containing protein